MTNILDDYALMSPLRHRNNWLKLTIVLFGLLAGVSAASPIPPLFIAFCMSFATLTLGKTPLKLYFKLLLAPMGFAIAGILIIAFFSGSGVEGLMTISSVSISSLIFSESSVLENGLRT